MVWVQNVFGQSPYTLTGDETWGTGGSSVPLAAANGIVVGGFELKINSTTVTLNSGKSISVGTGGLLEINSSIITGGLSNTWVGIIATRSGSLEQFSTFPTDVLNDPVQWAGVLNPNQTQVICTNAEIRKAETGIKSNGGAIVRTRDSEFLNCEKGVVIESYKSLTNPEVNACFFMGTDFNWTTVLSGFSSSDFIGITLSHVRGVNIGGCNFINSDATLYCTLTRGTGIEGIESDFGISTDGDELYDDGIGCSENCFSSTGDGNPSTFEGITFGVVTNGHHSARRDRIGIRDCSFEDVLFSVDIEFSKHSVIFESSFNANRSAFASQYEDIANNGSCEFSTATVGNFVSINESGAARIVENSFTFDNPDFEYLRMNATGTNGKSLIQKNNIHNTNSGIDGADNVIGILSQGNNSNLDIKCNDFDNLSNDIFIATSSTLKNIEENLTGASNQNNWSTVTISNVRINIFNDGANIEIKVQNGGTLPSKGGANSSNTIRSFTSNVITCDPIDDCNILTDETGVGIKNIKYGLIQVYPNPATNLLNIELISQINSNANIVIFDLQGKEILNENLNRTMQVDVSTLPAGLFLVKVVNGNNIYTQKLIKR